MKLRCERFTHLVSTIWLQFVTSPSASPAPPVSKMQIYTAGQWCRTGARILTYQVCIFASCVKQGWYFSALDLRIYFQYQEGQLIPPEISDLQLLYS